MTDGSNSPQQQGNGTPTTAKGEAPFIEMRGISKRFGGVRALQDVNLSIHAAEIHSLAGENGCGKSTLIKVLSGIHMPDEGQIILEGKAHNHLTPDASQRFGVQIIYQDLSLFPNLTVAENIAFRHHVETPVRLANRNVMRKQAQAVMDRLKVSLPLDELVGTLPIATRQLVAICRALAADARLVVMDEPTASLSHQEVEGLLAVVHELKRQKIANLFVSHRLDEVMDIAERVTVMRDGRNFGTYPVSELDRRRLGELITGHVFDSSVKPPFSSEAAPALEVRDLSCTGQYTGISFESAARRNPGPDGPYGLGAHRARPLAFWNEPSGLR